MKLKLATAAALAALCATLAACTDESGDDCEWELENVSSVAYVEKPNPPRPPANKVPAVKIPTAKLPKDNKPVKMPDVKTGKSPVPMPNVTPQKPSTAPRGKVWELDCD